MTNVSQAVLDLLDKEAGAINLTGIVMMLPEFQSFQVKDAVGELYDAGRIHRIPTVGPNKRYYTYLSLYVQTLNGYTSQPPASGPITTDEALAVLERAGWKPEPEIVEPIAPAQAIGVDLGGTDVTAIVTIMPERRTPDRRRLTVLDVITRWRLAFPLARVVEIIGESRKQGLSRDQAALAIRMLREHVKQLSNH